MYVFGQIVDGIREYGLVDAVSSEEFDQKLQACCEDWETCKKAVLSKDKPVFFEWFLTEKATEVKESMLSCLREATGLGSPLSPFYTNTCECFNSVLHEKVKYKKLEWHKFNKAMQELVKQSYQIAKLAVIDNGDFQFKR